MRKLPAKFEDFFKLANFFYTAIGMELMKKKKLPLFKSLLASFIFYVGIINTNYVLCMQIIYASVAIKNGNKFLEATMTLAYVGFMVLSYFKMLFFWCIKSELTKFLNRLKYIFPSEEKQQQKYNLHKYLSQCTRLTLVISIIYMIAVWTSNLFPLANFLIYEKWLHIRQIEKSLPFFMYTPWDWTDHWSFYVLYVSQVFSVLFLSAGQTPVDLMLSSCVTQIIMHYDFLSKTMEDYKLKLLEKGANKEKVFKDDMEFLKKIIQYHSYLSELCLRMNNIFGLPILLNFACSSFVICFLGFQMTTGAAPEFLLKLIIFLVSFITQIYSICYYSQKLIDASINVAIAVHNHDWPSADVRYQKMLILITAKAQKPAQLKATTLVLISRETMTQLMQISYKFLALLRTMYVKK